MQKADKKIRNLCRGKVFSCRLSASLDFLALEDGTHTLSRNVGKGLLVAAA
jgi:hypothetical protein